MNRVFHVILLLLIFVSISCTESNSIPSVQPDYLSGIPYNDSMIKGWATSSLNYVPGNTVAIEYQTPEKALGPGANNVFDIVSLGEGGQITLEFSQTFKNGPGYDFGIFENGLDVGNGQIFGELAFVEISSNGQDFLRFPSLSLTPDSVGKWKNIYSADISGLAGKFPLGRGTPFDLDVLINDPLVLNDSVNLNAVRYIRIIDVLGGGIDQDTDSEGNLIHDAYNPDVPTAGFDLESACYFYRGLP